MDAFTLHSDVVQNYKQYLESFTTIQDQRIKQHVEKAFEQGGFIPEPLIQFNPAFAKGGRLQDLVDAGKIHQDVPDFFGSYQLYYHQYKALELGVEGKGFIVTSGTGSGKSLTYLATIFDYILKQRHKERGIKAILVYPMNALINSQEEEIRKYHLEYLFAKIKPDNPKQYKTLLLKDAIEQLETTYNITFPITYRKYTGQEGQEARDKAKEEQPDIILTNYMMLELIMTRQAEDWLRRSIAQHLQFLVFDELHTYRGRQGSDVSFLVRRIKHRASKELLCIGTSATMITEGAAEERKQAVADVAATIFSTSFTTDQIVEESLTHSTHFTGTLPSPEMINAALQAGIQMVDDAEQFLNHPLAVWLENAVALKHIDEEHIEREQPMTLSHIAEELRQYTGIELQECKDHIVNMLQWAEKLNKQEQACLPFKLHQFISQTSTVYVTLDEKKNRRITIETGRFLKDERNQDRFIYPVLFSRHSGHEYLCVELDFDDHVMKPRDPEDFPPQLTTTEAKKRTLQDSDFPAGYLVIQDDENEELWSDEMIESLPDSWWTTKNGTVVAEAFYQYQLPRKIYFDAESHFSFTPDYPMWGWYLPAKLRVDMTAGIIYEDIKTKENTKLMRLGNEGRSTATTIMAYSIIKALHEQGERPKNQKLLSFTDNRQDASLQAGHFNDFLSTVRLRSALHHALQEHPEGLRVYDITERLVEQLQLKESDYAKNPNDEWPDDENERALKEYVLIRLLYDLKRGWRYTLPNLEQCGLLRIEYEKLELFVQQEQFFEQIPILCDAESDERIEILKQVLDYFRTSYAISHQKILQQRAETENFLKTRLDDAKLWSLDQDERIDIPYYLVVQSPGKKRKRVYTASLGPRSNLGKYFKRLFAKKDLEIPKGTSYEEFLSSVCDLFVRGNFLTTEKVQGMKRGTKVEVDGYRLRTDKIIWKPGDGQTVPTDPIRMTRYKTLELSPNQFFQVLYAFDFTSFHKPIVGREHTGQLSSDDRIEREEDFRSGVVSSLFCSPTMELGIDIANLNVVHMRNVPPNPANYAQRSGRAGRSGQAAVVFTYCSSWSPHDRNYFKQKDKMISGAVVPPRIELMNEELIRSHLDAYILMELELGSLKLSVDDVIDVTQPETLPLKEEIIRHIEDQQRHWQQEWKHNFSAILGRVGDELQRTYWFNDNWLHTQTATFLTRFDAAFNRWRTLYTNVLSMKERAQAIIDDPTVKYSSPEKEEARRQRAVAEKQVALLRNEQNRQYGNESEFYVFRYLAAEGFLPGYNFTRLPVRAFVGYRHREEGEYISRPRFLALREFGPMNLIYHKGNKYGINRMMLLDAEAKARTLKVSKRTGYAFLDDEALLANNDPITHQELKGDTVEINHHLLEISESEGHPQERISCEEEERMARGFDIHSYFRYPHGIESTYSSVIKAGNHPLLQVMYGPATELIQVNRKWKRSQDAEGFYIDNRTGKWLRQRDLEHEETAEHARQIMLFARDTADSLYIQPMKDLEVDADQIITLSYALKRGIERLFQVEENEINVLVLGDRESPNILIYEAAEGSLGILSQLVQHPAQMKRLFREAYKVLHFNPETRQDEREDLPKATYDDLLSYYNQPYHDRLDRHRIKEPLERLMDYNIEPIQEGKDREQQYQYLLERYDTNSATELPFLQFLYENGYALPDKAQVNMPEFYINADFVYNLSTGPVLIFCDGSVHDVETVQQDDRHKRTLLRDAGYDVIEWPYTESLESLVTRRKDVFRKVC